MPDDFAPGKSPTYSYSKTTKTRTLRTDFGDGYSQRAGDGLNSIGRSVDLEFNGLTVSQANSIETFLEGTGGYEAFTYTLPDEASAKKWIAKEWNRTAQSNTIRTIHVTLEQVFDL